MRFAERHRESLQKKSKRNMASSFIQSPAMARRRQTNLWAVVGVSTLCSVGIWTAFFWMGVLQQPKATKTQSANVLEGPEDDYSTPIASLQSRLRSTIRVNQEMLASLKVHSEEEVDRVRVLYVTYRDSGQDRKEVLLMEKMPRSGEWVKASYSHADLAEMRRGLGKRMLDWQPSLKNQTAQQFPDLP